MLVRIMRIDWFIVLSAGEGTFSPRRTFFPVVCKRFLVEHHDNVLGYESSGYETSMGTKRLDTTKNRYAASFGESNKGENFVTRYASFSVYSIATRQLDYSGAPFAARGAPLLREIGNNA